MATAIAKIEGAITPLLPELDPNTFAVFRSIPPYHHDVVTLGGKVIVYETDSLCRDGIQEGAFYVRESQYPVAAMEWETWLRRECQDEHVRRRAQPRSPLKTSRDVVQVVRWPKGEDLWMLRMASGFSDGPFEGWSLGHNFVGRAVGIYAPFGLEVQQ